MSTFTNIWHYYIKNKNKIHITRKQAGQKENERYKRRGTKHQNFELASAIAYGISDSDVFSVSTGLQKYSGVYHWLFKI